MIQITKALGLSVFVLSLSAYGDSLTLKTTAAALGANDSLAWNFLGPDTTTVPSSFSGMTPANRNVVGTLTGNQGTVAVVGSSWGPASGPFTNGDTLLWAFDSSAGVNAGSGPLTLTFPAALGVGAAIQADSPGVFTATLELFKGATLIGTVTETSDAKGDALFIGALNTNADVTKAVFGLSASGGDNADFAIDTLELKYPKTVTPEPRGIALLCGLLAGVVLLRRRKAASHSAIAVLAVCAFATVAFAQEAHIPKGRVIGIPAHNAPATVTGRTTAELNAILASPNPLPSWTYTVKAYDGKNYTGTILGRSPYNHGKTTTIIPTQIIPLVITIKDASGTIVYDPTAADVCVPGHTGIEIIQKSPIFTNNTWVMNGVNVGDTQYEDANLRAEFWSLIGNTPYHLILQESTLASQALSFGTGGTSGPGSNFSPAVTGNCEEVGVVRTDDMDAAIQTLIAGPLAGLVNIGTFPLFLTRNVVMSDTDTNLFGSGCCTLGFHSSFTVGTNLQLYGPFEVDTASAFGPGYTDVISHEVGEGIHDPTGANPTPPWGNQGQQSACQNNFEDGDPLSQGGVPPTSNEWTVNQNSLTYDLQELAFFNWFYGGASLGTGGLYSNNGTFLGFAKACPPGGTN